MRKPLERRHALELLLTYLPVDVPRPTPDPWEQPFWQFCLDRRLKFQSCVECSSICHPPLPRCPACGSNRRSWVDATEDAEIYTYTIVHYASHPSLKQALPYNAAVVIFPSLGGVRVATNVVDCDPRELRIGLPVTLRWEEVASDLILPRFTPDRSRMPS